MTHNNESYYDDFAGWYENNREKGYHALIDQLELDIIRPLAKDGDVLEVGCGTGLIMKEIQQMARSVKGIDISEQMLEKARARGLDVCQGVAETLPWPDNSFDLTYSFKVLAHVEHIKEALQEMQRVLRPGGYMVAEFYNTLSIRHLAKVLGGPGNISASRTEADVFCRWDTPREVRSYLPHGMVFQGFKGVRVFTPIAKIHDIVGVKSVLQKAEKWALNSPLARFGGFLVAVCKKC
ncbi:MAG: class I SAM-dependent methyltransferase [Deltaproteobacteria bacterium]|nr:class I SAM-dependent methyltransferase [Deltaproteobacteria bacterium]